MLQSLWARWLCWGPSSCPWSSWSGGGRGQRSGLPTQAGTQQRLCSQAQLRRWTKWCVHSCPWVNNTYDHQSCWGTVQVKCYCMKVTDMMWPAPCGTFPGKAQSWKTALLSSQGVRNRLRQHLWGNKYLHGQIMLICWTSKLFHDFGVPPWAPPFWTHPQAPLPSPLCPRYTGSLHFSLLSV